MAAQQSDDGGIESTPPPAVSSLRSRFEKLAADASPASSSASSLKPSGSAHHLTPVPPSPRLRPHPPAEGEHDSPVPRSPLLRPVSSASDLKAATKRPPPPPPVRPSSRAPSPANPRVSPLVHPVSDSTIPPPEHELLSESISTSSVSSRAASISRRPPPPPPLASQDQSTPRTPAVSSLIKQFGTCTMPRFRGDLVLDIPLVF
ncbi:hypothetical protein C8Q77DRAFT_375154 [Trametes polyzona]|nr:hypothetical protein C8Q77DRAFT_375154 [Trametes polyzona]